MSLDFTYLHALLCPDVLADLTLDEFVGEVDEFDVGLLGAEGPERDLAVALVLLVVVGPAM